MNNWYVQKDGSAYIFYPLNKKYFDPGIYRLTISLYPEYGRSETHVRTYDTDTYKQILMEGKKYAHEVNSTALNQTNRVYYFESLYDIFADKDDETVKNILLDEYKMMSYLENNLSRCDEYNNPQSAFEHIQENLNLLSKVEPNVKEIIGFMREKICGEMLENNEKPIVENRSMKL